MAPSHNLNQCWLCQLDPWKQTLEHFRDESPPLIIYSVDTKLKYNRYVDFMSTKYVDFMQTNIHIETPGKNIDWIYLTNEKQIIYVTAFFMVFYICLIRLMLHI